MNRENVLNDAGSDLGVLRACVDLLTGPRPSHRMFDVFDFLLKLSDRQEKKRIITKIIHYSMREKDYYYIKKIMGMFSWTSEDAREYLDIRDWEETDDLCASPRLIYPLLLYERGYGEKKDYLKEISINQLLADHSKEHIEIAVPAFFSGDILDDFLVNLRNHMGH